MDFRNLLFQSHWSNHYKHHGFSLSNKHHGQIVVIPMVVVNHRWQSESTDGPTGGLSCVVGMAAMVAVVTLPQLLAVVWCSVVVVVVAVVAVVVV